MLYRLHLPPKASPKAISGRTSYLHVRLEFLPYAQLIPGLFNAHGFEPPRDFTRASLWPRIDHCGFGPATTNCFALFGLAFAPAPCLPLNLAGRRNSLVHSSIGTPSLSLRLLLDIRFQVLFHSPPGVLFTFPSRYFSLSVAKECLALEGGPPCFPQSSSCSAVLWVPAGAARLSPTGLLPPAGRLPSRFDFACRAFCRPSTPPGRSQAVWAYPRSLAATWGISFDFFSSGYLDVSLPQVPPRLRG